MTPKINKKISLNKRPEFVSKCRHRSKFKLRSFNYITLAVNKYIYTLGLPYFYMSPLPTFLISK